MTAISVTGTGFAPGSTRLRLTVRGRRVLASMAAVPAAIALALALISGGAAIAASDSSAPVAGFQTVTVAPGDSLWSIAERVAPGADPRDVVDAIARLNALDGGQIAAGQSLAIPAEYASQP
jgi:Tfp pilus assembly protein FimV